MLLGDHDSLTPLVKSTTSLAAADDRSTPPVALFNCSASSSVSLAMDTSLQLRISASE